MNGAPKNMSDFMPLIDENGNSVLCKDGSQFEVKYTENDLMVKPQGSFNKMR